MRRDGNTSAAFENGLSKAAELVRRTLATVGQREASGRVLVLIAEQRLDERDLQRALDADAVRREPAQAGRRVDHRAARVLAVGAVFEPIACGAATVELHEPLPAGVRTRRVAQVVERDVAVA